MNNTPFSLITITSGRNEHLRNLIRGAEISVVKPDEIVIIYMNQKDELDIDCSIPIHAYHVDSDHLPLAEARNKGATVSKNEHMIFLDVDCIPSSTMFKELLECEAMESSLIMGTPRYLNKETNVSELSDIILQENSIFHEAREHLKLGYSQEYTSFWSLCFALTKKTFTAIGGFDNNFIGYGGEDTDFAIAAQKANIAFYISSAECYHQHHGVYKPPVQHVDDIVINSNYFYTKWSVWPMTHWLDKFKRLGYIRWDVDSSKPISVVHLPTQDEQRAFEDTQNAY